MKRILEKFSNDLLSARMSAKGFYFAKDMWYKRLPDVFLCIGIRDLRRGAFDLCFGIVPDVCIPLFRNNILCFQPAVAYYGNCFEEYLHFYEKLNGLPNNPSKFFQYSIDPTVQKLNDPNKYEIFLEYWWDVFEKTAASAFFNIHDLSDAMEAIGDYLKFAGYWDADSRKIVHEKIYRPDHAPALMKLGRPQEFHLCLDIFMKSRYSDKEALDQAVETYAKAALEKGVNRSLFLWYWLMENNDTEGMNAIVKSLEEEAKAWFTENKLIV